MNKLTLFLFLLAFTFIVNSSVSGQKVINFTSGEHKIFDDLKISLDQRSVKIFSQEEVSEYSANEINFITINVEEKYASKKVAIDNKRDYYLLRKIEEGQVDFFAYKEKTFFIQGENKTLEKLYYTRKDISSSRIDTMYYTLKEEGSFYVTKQYLTIIQDHLGPSYTVSNNLRLKERSVKKAVQKLNSKFPLKTPTSYFNPLVSKRIYLGAVGLRNKTNDEIVIAPQLGYEIGTNYTGMLTTGYISYTYNSFINEEKNSAFLQNLQSSLSFGIRQYLLKNKFIKPYIDFGVQNESLSLQSGLLITKSNYILSGSINIKNGVLGTSAHNLGGIFQFNLGYQL